MNKERLTKLTERADQAVKVAADLASLEAADPYCYLNTDYKFRDNKGMSLLSDTLLKECLAAGRLRLIEKYEAVLENLIATEPEELSATDESRQ